MKRVLVRGGIALGLLLAIVAQLLPFYIAFTTALKPRDDLSSQWFFSAGGIFWENFAVAIVDGANRYRSQMLSTGGSRHSPLEPRGGRPTHRAHAGGHAHIDSAWLWPIREARRKIARPFSNVLRLQNSNRRRRRLLFHTEDLLDRCQRLPAPQLSLGRYRRSMKSRRFGSGRCTSNSTRTFPGTLPGTRQSSLRHQHGNFGLSLLQCLLTAVLVQV